jgi:YidC/Oxa1 family membrane protein insertase
LTAQDESLKRALQESNYAVSSDDSVLQIGEGARKELTFTFRNEQAGLEVTKRFVFHGSGYDFEFSVDAKQNGRPLDVKLIVGPSFGDQSIKKTDYYTLKAPLLMTQQGEKINRIDAGKPPDQPLTGDIRWTGIEDNYFALVLIPKKPINQVDVLHKTVKETQDDDEIERHFIAAAVPADATQTYTVFAGPQDADTLRDMSQKLGGVNLEDVINYGMFSSVVKPILNWLMIPALDFAHRYTGNYGVAIIVLTLVLNMFFFPLRRSSSLKMRKTAAVQPRMREVQEKMKGLKRDDPKWQQLQMEQLKLMREANPLGGCLPMLLQLPVFWAIFVLLTISFDVRQAPFFGWIDDLSSPDRWHVLPIAMCVSMIASTIMMPMPAPDPSQKFQKIMTAYLMPVALTFLFFWSAPSGLVLYWMFSNIAGIIQQVLINRLNPISTTAQPEGEKKSAAKPAVST